VNGVHDLAGTHGYGRVAVEDGEAFHEEWEKRVFGLRVAMLNARRIPRNLDEARYALENLEPHVYAAASYYERWLLAGEQIYLRHGAFTAAEIEARRRELAARPDAPPPRNHEPELVERVLHGLRAGVSTRRTLDAEPRYAVGDHVRTRNVHTTQHTRLARYLRDKRGVIDRIHGAFDLPELAAAGESKPEYVYEVRFEGAELWGDSAEPNTCVYAQLWESYLLPA
jgi:nitrile hydratase